MLESVARKTTYCTGINTYGTEVRTGQTISNNIFDESRLFPTGPSDKYESHDLTVSQNWFKNTPSNAIYHEETAYGLQIVDNLFTDIGFSAILLAVQEGLYYEDAIITGNQIRRTQSQAVQLNEQKDLTIEHNKIEDAGLDYDPGSSRGAIMFFWAQEGITERGYLDVSVQWNDLRDSLTGITVLGPVDNWENVTIANNTFKNNHYQVWDHAEEMELDAILDDNTFPDEKAKVVGNTIQDILEGHVYNIDTGYVAEEIQPVIDEIEDLDTPTELTTYNIKVASGTYTEPVEIIQNENKNIVIQPFTNGSGGEYVDATIKGNIRIDGDGRHAADESLTIKGFTFDFSDATEGSRIIHAGEPLTGKTFNYSHNIFIKDSHFIGNHGDGVSVVAIGADTPSGHTNWKIENVTGEDLHSLGQLRVDGLEITDCSIEGNGNSGFNLQNSKDITISGFYFKGGGYGIRAGAGSEAPRSVLGNPIIAAPFFH